jgi:hypothetical protein
MTVGEQCAQAFVALLADRLAVPVERNRESPVDLAKFERYVLIDDGPQAADTTTTTCTRYTRALTIHGLVAGADAIERADALYAAIVQAVASDAQLGGLAIDCREGEYRPGVIEVEFAGRGAGFALDYEVEFATAEGDPTVRAA